MGYKQIIGIDFGHGEVSAHCAMGKKIFQLRLDPRNDDKTMITAIAYDKENNPLIGANTKYCSNAIPYFKASPSKWHEEIDGMPKKTLMRDFFRQLIKQIAEANKDDITVTSGDTLLFVGCPSSKIWTGETARQQYAELVREATGIMNVHIIPESRAAIFSTFVQMKDLQIDANRGIAVFDFGSSTADFTYIQLGVCEREYSWTLGASMIEQMIVQNEIAKLRVQGMEVDLYDVMGQTLEVRGEKERFFDALAQRRAYKKKITLTFVRCENGQPKPLLLDGKETYDEDGQLVYEEVECAFTLNKEYMSECLTQDVLIPVYENGNQVFMDDSQKKNGSWKTLCHLFFETMKKRLDDESLPCDFVVLTGGASKMNFVKEACGDVFHDSTISVESNPSGSVSIGLCYLGQGQERMPEVIEGKSDSLRGVVRKGIENMMKGFADEVSPILYDEALKACGDITGNHKINEVTDIVTKKLDSNKEVFAKKLEEKTEKVMEDWKTDFSKNLNSYASEVVKECYPGLMGKVPMRVDDDYANRLIEEFGVNLSPEKIIDKLDIRKMTRETTLGAVIDEVINGVALAVSVIGLMTGNPLLLLSSAGKELIDKWKNKYVAKANFTVKNCENLPVNLKKNEEKTKEKIKELVGEELRKMLQSEKLMGENFILYLDEAAKSGEHLAKVVALQDFDV